MTLIENPIASDPSECIERNISKFIDNKHMNLRQEDFEPLQSREMELQKPRLQELQPKLDKEKILYQVN